MKLTELIQAVQEKRLSKDELENYRDDMAAVSAQMHIEMAELEKEEALYLDTTEEKTAVAASRKWAATHKGQRQIELKHYIRATDKLIASLRSRLYSMY